MIHDILMYTISNIYVSIFHPFSMVSHSRGDIIKSTYLYSQVQLSKSTRVDSQGRNSRPQTKQTPLIETHTKQM